MNSRQPVHQLVHTLSYGDAISTEVLAMQRALRGLGHASEIYAIGEHPQMRGRSRPYKEVLDQQGADSAASAAGPGRGGTQGVGCAWADGRGGHGCQPSGPAQPTGR